METITICGSYRYLATMFEWYRVLTERKNIVFLPAFNGVNLTHEEFRNIHFEKIRHSDAIFVVNSHYYIGDATREEIEYAKSIGKDIRYAHMDECFNKIMQD